MSYILIVHHDADLYGADKSLLQTVRALKTSPLIPILVVPHEGPLVDLLLREGVEVHIGPVGKLTRQLLSPLKLPAVLADMVRSVRYISRLIAGREISLVYTNSVAALGGALWAAIHRRPRLWHVREIVVTPKVAARGFPAMLQYLGGWCVCNSSATRRWIVDTRPKLTSISSVVWNGIDDVVPQEPGRVQDYRAELGFDPAHVVVTLVGRINRWKGQGVLIDAAQKLRAGGQDRIRFLIVGDVADGQHHFRLSMLAAIRQRGLEEVVKWQPFTQDVDLVWSASDVAVVPSTEPEPFGRVAIEAMAHGLPVIAANHGGLVEIVDPGRTGLLVAPGSSDALAAAIETLAQDPERRRALGAAGYERQRRHFSQAENDRKLLALMTALAAGSRPLDSISLA